MENKIDMVKLFAAIYRSLHIYKGVAESMDRELKRQGFVAIDTPNGVRFAEIKQLQYTNDAPLGEDRELNLIYPTELAESKFDMIRNEIIAFVEQSIHRAGGKPIPREQEDKWLAWFEKQGEHANFLSKIQVGDKVTRNEDGVLVNLSQLNRVAKKRGEQKLTDKVEPKFKVKYAGSEYNVFWTRESAGITFYGIEDEPNHIAYVNAENCEIVSEQKPAWKVFDEEMVSAVITDIQFAQKTHPNVNQVFYEREIDWIKSLKDRCTWKPSEEQIEMLENVRKILHTNKDIYSKANNLMYNFEEFIRTLEKLKG